MIIILIIFVLTILIWKLVKNSPRTIEYIKIPENTPPLNSIFNIRPAFFENTDKKGNAQMFRSNIERIFLLLFYRSLGLQISIKR